MRFEMAFNRTQQRLLAFYIGLAIAYGVYRIYIELQRQNSIQQTRNRYLSKEFDSVDDFDDEPPEPATKEDIEASRQDVYRLVNSLRSDIEYVEKGLHRLQMDDARDGDSEKDIIE